MEERSLVRAKINSDYNDFVARVALEVVDSAWWKRQLRVRSAGQRNNSLVIDNPVPLLQSMVITLGLVCTVNRTQTLLSEERLTFPRGM